MSLSHERRGQGEPLVLVHGIGSQWQMWAPVLDAVAASRDAIAVDLPGFGESPRLDEPPTPERLAEAVAELLDALGLETAHVAGNSLGGGIALELGRLGRARSVCGLSPVGFQRGPERIYTYASMRAMAAFTRKRRRAQRALEHSHPGRILAGGQIFGRPWAVPPAALEHATASIRHAPGFDPALPRAVRWDWTAGDLPVPVTIAWGTRDRLLLPHQALRARRLMPSARLVWLTGCGHIPMWDDHGQVADALLRASVDDAQGEEQDQGDDGRDEERAEAAEAVREEEEHRPGGTR